MAGYYLLKSILAIENQFSISLWILNIKKIYHSETKLLYEPSQIVSQISI